MKSFHAILFLMTSAVVAQQTTVTHAPFGKLAHQGTAEIFTITSPDVEMRVTSYGARVVSLATKDRDGKMGGIVLGYDNVDDYVKDTTTYFGSVPGRYANRIAKGKFTLDGQSYQLPINNPPNSLHGGTDGFASRNWQGKPVVDGVEFTLVSPNGDQGYPGKLTAHVRYLLRGNTLRIEYSAITDAPTVVNLTNHAYFNLAGDGHGTILDQRLTIDADKYTPIDPTSIPLGPLAPVEGTPFDFRTPHTIGSRINDDNQQLKNGSGYDHNFVLRGKWGDLRPAARVYDPSTGRALSISTTEPGVQFYSGNFLNGTLPNRNGGKYEKHAGLCLETQHFPDSPNEPSYPTTVLKPGDMYRSITTWTFTTEK